jgi:hypothetical protein
MEERIRRDDKMCAEINRALDNLGHGSDELSYAIGWIKGCMRIAGRRDERDMERGTDGTEKTAG